MKLNKQALLRRRGLVPLFVLTVFVLGALLLIGFEGSTCSFLRAICQYDPRIEHPNSLFIERRPEPFVVQYIEDQVKANRTFPITATSSVSSVEPVSVTAGGFNTDWHIEAHILVAIHYLDGTERDFNFDMMETSAANLLGIEKTTMFASFGPISECETKPERSMALSLN